MPTQRPITPPDMTALILAGGRGSRMGGRDKGLLQVAGKPLVEHLLERLQDQVHHILVSANRNLEQYAVYGHPLVEDTLDGFAGPLAGMLAGLRACRTEYLLTVPVDAPLLDGDFAARMAHCIADCGKPACYATANGRLEPVYSLLHRDLADNLQAFLDRGQRAVRDWMQAIGAGQADFSDRPEQFLNLNTEQDQRRLQDRLAERLPH